jgi:hypothetical protein
MSSSVVRNLVQLLKLLSHSTIIGMAILFITCLALFPGKTDGFMVLQYILDIMLIAANLYPSGSYAPHPHAAWFGINLFFILFNWKKNYSDTIHGLVDNDVILNHLNPGKEERHLVLFWASVTSWLIILGMYIVSLGLAKCLQILDETAMENVYVVNGNEEIAEKKSILVAVSAILKKLVEMVKKSVKKTPEIEIIA